MEKNDDPCPACGDLEECNLRIVFSQLQDGCQACRLLKAGVSSFVDEDALKRVGILDLSVDISLHVTILGRDEGDWFMVVEFYTNPGSPSIWPHIGPGGHVSTNPSADSCVSLARNWLRGCLASHRDCQRTEPPELPTRVIEVGQNDEEARIFVNTSEKRAEYAALSHCWGGAHPTLLLAANLQSMQEKLVLNASSKTFSDAIGFTRRLGIPYLWIDSLCILQDKDDTSDWEEEAPRMSSVYNGATVTLSAASSADTTGGLYASPEARASCQRVVEISAPSPDGSMTTVYVRGRQRDPGDIGETVHSLAEPEVAQLRSRAWVLQEEQLSPRILHFRKEELAWTCTTCSRCECRIRPSLPQPHPFRASPDSIEESDMARASVTFHEQWPDIVMDYTRRVLSQPHDRVAALSGLASYIEDCSSDNYYCGMWYEDMNFQLSWYVDRPTLALQGIFPPRSRFTSPYAQTWSWMSVPGPISYVSREPLSGRCLPSLGRSGDAITPFGHVVGVGRIPVDGGYPTGPMKISSLFLMTGVVRIVYDRGIGQWQTPCPISDFASENLKIYMDVDDDEAALSTDEDAQYVLILIGRWEGQGITILDLETVCILARKLSTPSEIEDVLFARKTQMEQANPGYGRPFQSLLSRLAQGSRHLCCIAPNQDDSKDTRFLAEEWRLPDPELSYRRIGLVRGAGSFDAWEQAGALQMERVFLF